MRITGGVLVGRSMKCPNGVIRPAMDRMRESIFSILGDLSGKSWLDLFSGSGTIAIEAVSRGASHVELCEKDKIKIPVILENVSVTERELGVTIGCHFMAAELFLKRCRGRFDYIFLDPPFPYQFRLDLLRTVDRRGLLTDDGTLLVHHPAEAPLPNTAGGLTLSDKRIYGRSVVSFYRKNAQNP